MFDRLRRFIHEERRWHAEHKDAWAAVREPGSDGISRFQRECEQHLVTALSARGLSLHNRRIEGDSERVIVGEVPTLGATVWIYLDQTDIVAPGKTLRFEQWDTKTPDQHYARVVKFVSALSTVSWSDSLN